MSKKTSAPSGGFTKKTTTTTVAKGPVKKSQPRSIQKKIKDEVKTIDATWSGTKLSIDATAANSILPLNVIPTGNSAVTRVGKTVWLRSVHIRGQVNGGTTTVITKCCILLVYVRNTNQAAAVPPWADILTTQSPNSLTNRDNATKFKILRRWDFAIAGNSTTAAQQTASSIQTIDEFVSFKKPLQVQWTAGSSTGAFAEMEKGALLLCFVGGGADAGTTSAQSYGQSRVYFTELA